jgi:Ribonuclease G/E
MTNDDTTDDAGLEPVTPRRRSARKATAAAAAPSAAGVADAADAAAESAAPAERASAKKATAAKKVAAKKTATTKKAATAKRAATAAKVSAAGDAPEDGVAPTKRATATKRTPAAKKATAAKPSSSAAKDADAEQSSDAPDVATEAGEPRTRTRTRSRRTTGTAPTAARPSTATADARAAARLDDDGASDGRDDPGPDDGSGEGSTGPSSGRRRRRGGRGRRRRGGGGGTGEHAAEGSDDADVDADDDGDPQVAPRAARTRANGGRSKAAEAQSEAEPRIARGSTRMAAKKANRSSGGGNGGGRGGDGQGSGQRRRDRPGGVTEEERRAILAGPPRTMLVTARPERTQIAVMEDRTLVEHYVTRDEDVTFVGNIYMGRVQNVLPGMEAAFVDIGKGRNGVLYAGEVLYDELDLEEESDQRIENVLKPGKKVLVQVTKDPMGTKGPRLTMHLSLAGRYVVLAPSSPLFGISRKLTDDERDRLRRIVKAAKPEGHGVIVRTAAEGATEDQLNADVRRLVERWEKVEAAAATAKPLQAVYEEPKLVVKVIRDIFGPDFERCIVDDETLFDQVRDYLDEIAPELVGRVELYGAPTHDARAQAAGAPALAPVTHPDTESLSEVPGDADSAHIGAEAAEVSEDTLSHPAVTASAPPAPESPVVAAAPADERTPAQRRRDLPALFSAFDVTDQLRQAMNRKVWLPSGGYLIIEATEAMKVIDVNTGRFTGGSESNLEEVVLKTNLEAAAEIVRQLRLRDMGGMIIIDFIDMLLRSNQEQVVRRLKRELLRDRTKTRVSDVSRLGLVQMTRKNVSQGLVESFSASCEACEGHGFITHLS